jgi:CheY-like chemotaxis protein
LIVDTAVNGAEGLDLIKVGGYSLILTDGMMPKVDGLTLLIQMKKMTSDHPNGPVVLCTNLASDAVCSQAIAAGAKDCLIKTDINPDQLLLKVKEYIGESNVVV